MNKELIRNIGVAATSIKAWKPFPHIITIIWKGLHSIREKMKRFIEIVGTVLTVQNSTRHDIRHELLHILVMGSVILFILQTPAYALTWTQVTANAAFAARDLSTSVVTSDGKMWVIGGWDGAYKRDVWYSTDGAIWTQATANAAWTGRWIHTSVVTSDGRMWVMGGAPLKNDVWYSTDGVSWTQATANAAWPARYWHTSVVTSDGRMWVIGGYDGVTKNDVWYSTNGVNWAYATTNAAWTVRYYHTSVVTSDGKMWVIGGEDGGVNKNDVWYSTTGVSWTQATANAGWEARRSHTSVVTSDGKMWVMGGLTAAGYKNDVWYSTDGVNWTQTTATAEWSARIAHRSVVKDSRMWVIGGTDAVRRNDVWYTNPIAVELIDFSAVGRGGFIELSWRTEAEIDNMKWLIIRCVGAYDNTPTEDYEQIATLPAESSLSDYEYIDSLVVPGVYWYKLGDVDNSGNITWHGPISAKAGGQPQGLPLRLEQPIPSPFRKEARIEYRVSGIKDIPVSLKIYDGSGQLIRVLIDEPQKPGRHVILWNAKDKDGKLVPSGIYFCSLITGESKLTRKLIRIF